MSRPTATPDRPSGVYAVVASDKAGYTIYQRYRGDSAWSSWISLGGTAKNTGRGGGA